MSMVSKDQKLLVIWPEYFDSNLTYRQGRRVSASAAVSNPRLEEIDKALTVLGMKHKLEPEACFPGDWHKKSGRALLSKSQPKTKIIKWVAKRIKMERQAASGQKQ